MSVLQNEVAADNKRRRPEETSKSPVGGVIEDAVSLARPALAAASAVVVAGASSGSGLAIAGSVVAGLGIVDWFRKLGTAKVNENLEALGEATEDALNPVERVLLEHGTSIDEIKSRLNSQDFKDDMASASLQALRTTQSNRLKRLALILANGVREDDLGPESLDDMMRAAVELKEIDVKVLQFISSRQESLLAGAEKAVDGWPHAWLDKVQRLWQESLRERGTLYAPGKFNGSEWRSSLSRLHSFGFIIPVQPNMTTNSLGEEPFGLLLDGRKFLDRLSEITG
jgi:DNA-binding transcriptional MerR regulator